MDSSEEQPSVHCRHCGDLHPTSFSHCPKTGRSLTAGRALVGRVIANRYRILALIGEGGMGAVYVAEHLLIGRKVAVKRLHPELASDDKAVARFQREARAAGSTGHEHIVDILDLGYADDGAPFLVMEYLRGVSLAGLLEREGQLEKGRACKIVGQVLDALSAVHAQGVVHRDLKPDNILTTRRRDDPEFVKVVDFGISKIRPEEGETHMDLTRTGVMLGTPFYMSPEQARGMKNLDHRVDLYGTGVILYECLAGCLPYDGDNYHQLLQSILTGKHTTISEIRPDIPRELADIVERAIASKVEARFQSATEFLDALIPFGARKPSPRGVSEAPPLMRPSFTRGMADTTPAADAAAERRFMSTPTREFSRSPTPMQETPDLRNRTTPHGVAPRPGTPAPAPRRFVAQSPDWRAPSRPSPAPAAPRPILDLEREPTGPRPRPFAVTELDVDSNATRIKGSLVIATTEHLASVSMNLMPRIFGRLDPDVARRVKGLKLPMEWLGLDDYVLLLRAAEREIGKGDGMLAIEIGMATADRELATTHRLFMRTTTPTMAVERIPQLFRTYHSGGRLTIEKAPTGGYRVETHDLEPDALFHAMAFSGFARRMLELAGGRNVRASVVSSRERGDEHTITVLRWR